MRLLFVTNFYPPAAFGGYEQWCQEVAEEFQRRGHSIRVLTSRAPGYPEVQTESGVPVYRWLNVEVCGGLPHTLTRLAHSRRSLEAESIKGLRDLVTTFQPDAAIVWGMWNIPRTVPAHLEELLGERVAYYLCDYWPSLPSAYVQQLTNPAAHWYTRLPKKIVGELVLRLANLSSPPRLRLGNAICVSNAVREILAGQGVPMDRARVIQGGIQVDDFQPAALARHVESRGLRLLYAGRLAPDKGVHTAIQAMALLHKRSESPITLDIVGSGDHHYVRSLRDFVRRHHLDATLRFLPGVPRSEMPGLLAKYDSLVFPSEWEEPFSRMVMEAMSTGLVVIGTLTGGTGDILSEGQTGLTFPPGNAELLAKQIERLRDAPNLRMQLARVARQSVEDRFSFTRMVDEIADALGTLVNG